LKREHGKRVSASWADALFLTVPKERRLIGIRHNWRSTCTARKAFAAGREKRRFLSISICGIRIFAPLVN